MLFERYQFGERTTAQYLMHTGILGVVAGIFSLLILAALPPAQRLLPGAVFGITAGLLLLLAGTYTLHNVQPGTAWGRALKIRTRHWFPLFLFSMQKTFFTLFALLLWAMLHQLGTPSSWLRNALFALLLILLPTKNIVHEHALQRRTEKLELVDDLLHYVLVSLATLLTVSIITSLTIQPGSPIELNMIDILLWIFASVVLAICLVLFLSRLPKNRPHPNRMRKRQAPLFIKENKKPEY